MQSDEGCELGGARGVMKKAISRSGYSMVELLVVMVIFGIVTIISAKAFETIFKKSSMEAKTAETGIMGMLGLEMMRTDIAQAGYGLPWSYGVVKPDYSEATSSPSAIDATSFNDDPTVSAPWPILSGTDSSTHIDYLVVKSSIGGMNPASRRWNFLPYSSGVGTANNSKLKMKGDSSSDLVTGDRVITLKTTFSASGVSSKQLVVDSGGVFYYSVPATLTPDVSFQPTDPTQTYIAYGIKDSNLTMPYNRVDFYVDKTATKPKSCNPGTGTLYKAVAGQNGNYVNYPLLDCVGDMQVAYDRDLYNDGASVLPIDGSVITTLRAASPPGITVDEMRSQIKNVRVYILAHDGKKDPSFSYPSFDSTYAVCVAPYAGSLCNASVGRGWTTTDMNTTFGNDWTHYRWKVYSFVVNLKNLR